MPPKDDTIVEIIQTATTGSSRQQSPPSPRAVLELEMEDLDRLEEFDSSSDDCDDHMDIDILNKQNQYYHNNQQQRNVDKKCVTFNEAVVVHDVQHLRDLDQCTKDQTWYTDRYLRMMRLCDTDDDDDDDNMDSNDAKLQMYMAARNVRRSRQLVLSCQARLRRQMKNNNSNNVDKTQPPMLDDEMIREEYEQVSCPCQTDASMKGRRMASNVGKIWESK